jgi:serine-type D-Ala-D-Ala carboxypeptidase/endopeptidase (penicillin-binding protein 4)
MKFSLFLLLAIILAGCSSRQATFETPTAPIEILRNNLTQKFGDTSFSNAHWGVLIKSLKTGEEIYARNEKKMFMPGSNMKLFTSSAALISLTPEYQYYTELITTGNIKDSILFGDIILKGSGDPSISGRYNEGKVTETFEQWADSLKMRGIKVVRGNLIGDDNCFDEDYYGSGWAADDETDYYAAQISGVSFNDNCIDFKVFPSIKIGDTCSLTWIPNTKYISVINQTITASMLDTIDTIKFLRKRGTNTIYVQGKLSQGKNPQTESVTVDNPTLYTMSIVKEVFESKGIKVNGIPLDCDDLLDTLKYTNTTHLASFTSLPYSALIKTINKPSQNYYAEQIFRTIGKEKIGVGSFDSSKMIVLPVLANWGVDTANLRMVDGSGLSRQNLVTPSDVIHVLQGMYKEKNFLTFYESLPVAGVDGTLKNRMKGTKAEGNVHAKTGFIGYVRALSGYVTSLDGEMFTFSLIVNNYTVSTKLAEKIQDDVCVMLAEFKREKN